MGAWGSGGVENGGVGVRWTGFSNSVELWGPSTLSLFWSDGHLDCLHFFFQTRIPQTSYLIYTLSCRHPRSCLLATQEYSGHVLCLAWPYKKFPNCFLKQHPWHPSWKPVVAFAPILFGSVLRFLSILTGQVTHCGFALPVLVQGHCIVFPPMSSWSAVCSSSLIQFCDPLSVNFGLWCSPRLCFFMYTDTCCSRFLV